MQQELPFQRQSKAPGEKLALASGPALLCFVRNPRARRYILRVYRERLVRITIPRGGSKALALDFLRRQIPWVEKQLQKAGKHEPHRPWNHGTEILFHGELVPLVLEPAQLRISFADQSFCVTQLASDLRPMVEKYLRELAARELTGRAMELARLHGLPLRRVVVRNQRSRWGSCSVTGTVSLNWRLIQTPLFVRDYLVLHELMHLQEMNHSPRFWQLVEQVCPDYRQAEKWLDGHGGYCGMRN